MKDSKLFNSFVLWNSCHIATIIINSWQFLAVTNVGMHYFRNFINDMSNIRTLWNPQKNDYRMPVSGNRLFDYFIGEQGSAGRQRMNFLETASQHLEATLMQKNGWKTWWKCWQKPVPLKRLNLQKVILL